MPQNLTDQQIAAALAEITYNRSQQDQALEPENFGGSDVILANLPQGLTSARNFDGSTYYYDDATGFAGKVVEANGKIFVAFRGIDLSGSLSDIASSLFNFFTGGPPSSKADPNDFAFANIPLGLGTTNVTQLDGNLQLAADQNAPSATQLDDALKLTRAAMAEGLPVVVVGQSLGGGLAGLVSATLNLPSILINPAPFENEIAGLAAKFAFAKNGIDIPSAFSSVLSNQFSNILANLQSSGSGALSQLLANMLSASQVGQFVGDWISEFNTLSTTLASNAQIYRMAGEALTSGPIGLALNQVSSQFLVPAKPPLSVGSINPLDVNTSVSLHGPALFNLAIATQGSGQDFTTLLQNDAALRTAFLSQIAITGPVDHERADPAGSPSKVASSGPNPTILYDSLWKTIDPGHTNSFYSQFYTRFSTWLANGAVAQGLSASTDDPLSLHSAVAYLGLQVVRDALLPSDATNIVTDDGRFVFGDGDTSGPSNGYVRIDLAKITAHTDNGDNDPQLLDPATNQPFGVHAAGLYVFNKIHDQLVLPQDQRDSIAQQLLSATPQQAQADSFVLPDWSTLIVQAGTQANPDRAFDFEDNDTSTGSDIVIGGRGSDTIKGGAGKDYLIRKRGRSGICWRSR